MINAQMRSYNYYTYGEPNAYGMPQLSESVQGAIKMAIHITSQSVQDNINYSGANYVGLTFDAVNDSYVIQYGDNKLKVLYVNPMGRYKQVFLAKI